MIHRFLSCQAFLQKSAAVIDGRVSTCLMVVSEQFVEKVNGFGANESLIIRIDEALPAFPRESAKDVVVLGIELNVVLVEVFKQVIRSQHLGYFD